MLNYNYTFTTPNNINRKAFESFVLTTTIQLACGESTANACAKGSIAALSSLLESISRPFVNTIFFEYPFYTSAIQLFAPRMTATSVVETLLQQKIIESFSLEIQARTVFAITLSFLRNFRCAENNEASIDIVS